MYSTEHLFHAKLTESNPRYAELLAFLKAADLVPDTDVDFTVNVLNDDDKIVATGSLLGNIIKYIAVSDSEQGSGLAAQVISELINHAYEDGINKLFLFTKPKNESMFRSMGFYTLAKTKDALMMETDARGLSRFLDSLEKPDSAGVVGAIVANCNPMTNGHLYLMETAAKACDTLHVFILSEDKSAFPADVRYEIVKEATAHIKNLYLHRSSEYIISSATFPTYFLKDQKKAKNINADLDLTLFGEKIAPYLGITKRFVGTEPYCAVTNAYNERMKDILPKFGIEVVEIERKDGISASRVRELMAEGRMDEIKAIVPEATYRYIVGTDD